MTAIGVVGGTGPQGRGLAYRFARGGRDVVLGSRDQRRALAAAETIRVRISAMPTSGSVRGALNEHAVRDCPVVLLTVPYEGHDELVAKLDLAGKILISCVNPLGFDAKGPFGLALAGGASSAAESAQARHPGASVVGAFHHLSAVSLWGSGELLADEDVLVVGDDPDAKEAVMDLARTVTGRRGIDAGPLRLARQLEPLTAVLISINKRYRTRAGVRIHGVQ